MPWTGAGTYNLPPAYSPEVNGTTIDAARYNGLTGDVATGITACLAKNGENTATANLPMGGFKHTGAGDATAAGQYVVFAQATAANIAGAWSAAALIPTGSTVPANGMYLPSANTLGWATNSTLRTTLNATGNWTMTATSASVLTLLNSTAGVAVAGINFGSTGSSNLSAGVGGEAASGTTGALLLYSVTGGALREAVRIAPSGASTFNAPTAGSTLTVIPFTDGTSGLAVDATISGNIVGALIANRSNTASSEARLWTYVAGTGAGDAFHRFTVDGATDWTLGIDNSDNDAFKLSLSSVLGTQDRFGFTTDGRFYGTALHNNAGAVTGTTNQYIASGTYTPTLTSVSNVSATTSNGAQWARTGNVVTVSGSLAIDPTSTNTFTEVGISLPIASNFTQTYHCAGTAVGALLTSNPAGTVAADTTNDRASLTFTIGTDVTNNNWFFTFTYLIL